ncbi:MAG TPA: nuclear transport factor 2 family protein, partial [Chitinophagaceae bacterium]|nr:nuclear transport factor 2 family protein [Chitinophagaceae bacterium]
MKLTKELEAEIRNFMDSYWDTYMKGDLQTWAGFLTDEYHNIGTTKEELWNSKQDILNYTNSVGDQMFGMAEFRNKQIQIIPYDPYLMVHELGDLYVKLEEGWGYYAPIRLSSLIQKQASGWQVLHQHGSYPDSKAQEGEAFAFDALKAENLKLQEAVRNRTIELEQKNRELEIEAVLERVRARAMALHKSEELHELIATVYQELVKLDITLNRCFIMINHKGSGDTTWWMASQENPHVQRGYLVPYHQQPPYLAYLDAWQKGQEK